MPGLIDVAIRFTRNIRQLVVMTVFILGPSTGFAYQCGDGNNACSLAQLASFLDRIKPGFETPDVVYDQIYSEGAATIVFIQRLKHRMDRSQREFVKEHGANKESSIDELCTDQDLRPILQQGLKLKYVVQDIDRHEINTFTIEYTDCTAN